MERTLPSLDWPPWVWLAAGALGTVWFIVNWWVALPFIDYSGGDWHLMLGSAAGLERGEPYAGGAYIYPPLATWVLATFVLPLGYPVVFFGHFAALTLPRPWGLALLALGSAPFWINALLGNFLTFSVVAGLLALRGSRVAGIAYLALFLLIPRIPLVPLAAWLVWKRPDLHLAAAAVAVTVVVGNLAVGHVGEWLTAAMSFTAGPDSREQHDWGPTRLLGPTWLIVGIPLGAWLTWKGRVAWAGLSVAPYLPPSLLLLLLFDMRPREKM